MRQTEQHQHRNIALAQLNLTNIRVMDACSGSECTLRQAALLAVGAEGRPKALEQRISRVGRG